MSKQIREESIASRMNAEPDVTTMLTAAVAEAKAVVFKLDRVVVRFFFSSDLPTKQSVSEIQET